MKCKFEIYMMKAGIGTLCRGRLYCLLNTKHKKHEIFKKSTKIKYQALSNVGGGGRSRCFIIVTAGHANQRLYDTQPDWYDEPPDSWLSDVSGGLTKPENDSVNTQ